MVADGLRGKRVSVWESVGLPFLPPQSLLTQGRVFQRVKQRSPGSAGERARALRRLRGVMRRWPLRVLLRVQMRTSQKVPLRASAHSRGSAVVTPARGTRSPKTPRARQLSLPARPGSPSLGCGLLAGLTRSTWVEPWSTWAPWLCFTRTPFPKLPVLEQGHLSLEADWRPLHLFVGLSLGGHVSRSHLLATVTSAAVGLGPGSVGEVQAPRAHVWARGQARFDLLNCQAAFRSGCTFSLLPG